MPPSSSGRVTNKDLFTAITDLRKELKADIKQVDGRIDDLVEDRGDLKERVTVIETEHKSLVKRVSAWDIGNTIGVLVSGALAYIGFRN